MISFIISNVGQNEQNRLIIFSKNLNKVEFIGFIPKSDNSFLFVINIYFSKMLKLFSPSFVIYNSIKKTTNNSFNNNLKPSQLVFMLIKNRFIFYKNS